MLRRTLLLVAVLALAGPASAAAATAHAPVLSAGILGSVGGVFAGLGHAVLGAFSWTIGLAAKFILTTIGALVKLLIPHSWVNQGLSIMEWIVAVPNYAGQITTPGGGHAYGFAGINDLRDLFMWLGIAAAPLTLVYATTRAMIGESEPVGIPVLRMAAIAIAVASYPYWWSQAAAVADQVTHAILTLPDVSRGLYKLMQYAVTGVALGGWQLIDLGLMAAIGIELLALIFLKVAVILLGAVLYATGPLMIGLVPTRAGGALARAWLSAVGMLFALGIGWATIFAAGAVLIADSATAGPLIAGNTTFGSLMGGLLLAVAGLASLWLCLKAGKEAVAIVRVQLSGLYALGHHRTSSASAAPSSRERTTGRSLREYRSRLAGVAGGVRGELAGAGAGGAATVAAGRAAGLLGRRGLLGTAAVGARSGGRRAGAPSAALLGRSRAGAVAVRMARAGTASWTASKPQANPAPERANGQAKRGNRHSAHKPPSPSPAATGRERQPGAAPSVGASAPRSSPLSRPAGRPRPATNGSAPKGQAQPRNTSAPTSSIPAKPTPAPSSAGSSQPRPVATPPSRQKSAKRSTPRPPRPDRASRSESKSKPSAPKDRGR